MPPAQFIQVGLETVRGEFWRVKVLAVSLEEIGRLMAHGGSPLWQVR